MDSPRNTWLPLGDIRISPQGRLETTVRLEPASKWFSGHFEAYPLVPGAAMLAFAAETVIRQGAEYGRRLVVSGFSRVRLRRLVFPDEEMHIAVAAMPSGPDAELGFLITCRGETVAEGFLRAGDALSGGGRCSETTT